MPASPPPIESLDLSNLRSITRGNREIEKDLFDAFLSSSSALLEKLEQLGFNDNADEFRRTAHSLKGEAANLGAEKLASISRELEHSTEAGQKEPLLKQAKEEWTIVADYLRQL